MRQSYTCYFCGGPRTSSGIILPTERRPASTSPFTRLVTLGVAPLGGVADEKARQAHNEKALRRLRRRFKKYGHWTKENRKGLGVKGLAAIAAKEAK